MSYHPVNIRVRDQNDQPVEGASVVIYTIDLQQHFSTLVSDGDGLVEALLFAPGVYDVRAHVLGSRTTRFRIEVEDTGPQEFRIIVPIVQSGESTHPDLCMVSERFLTPNGRPLSGVVQARLVDAVALRGAVTMASAPLPGVIRADGVYEEELPRGARVQFQIPGMEPIMEVTIPDASGARLMDLIAPYVTKIRFLEPVPETMGPYSSVEVPFELTRSDGKVTSQGHAPLEVRTTGPLTAALREHTLLLSSQSSGSGGVVLVERQYPPLPDAPRLNRGLSIDNGSFEVQVV